MNDFYELSGGIDNNLNNDSSCARIVGYKHGLHVNISL